MWTLLKLFAVLFLAITISDAQQKEKSVKEIDAEVFFKLRNQSNYQISPNAQYLAYIDAVNDHNNVFIKQIGKPNFEQLTNNTSNINSFLWGNKDYILYEQDTNGDENFRIYRLDIHTKEVKCLTNYGNVQSHILDLVGTKDNTIIITMNLRDPKMFDPYRLNIVTEEMELLYKNPGNIRKWMADNSGNIRIAQSNKLLYRKDDKSEFKEVFNIGPDEMFEPKFFTKDNDHVFAYSNIGRDKVAIVEFDLNKGKEVKVLFENPEYDAFGDDERDLFTYSGKKAKLLYARYTADKRELFFFDKRMERIYNKLKKKIGVNYEINFSSYSDELNQFIINVSSDRLEGKNYFYDDKSGKLELLNNESPWLDENEMAIMKPVSFKSRDGLIIHGYLTLPKGIDPKGLPVIVHPHAGPQWRNSWIFDTRIQFLANHGYAVFQVNFRGSTGYGKKFLRAGFKQWGLKMQDDITDGTNWLIEQGIADKKRIAIFGWSFGGYAALAGVTFTPDLYTCGVDLWGISNYFTLYRSFPPFWPKDQINERWGDIVKDSVQMYKTSPVFHADRIKAPLLIMQGENDVRVKKGQSTEMVDVLRKLNKSVEYVLIEGEGHGTTNERKIIDQMNKIDDFLAKYLKKKS